MSQGNVGVLGIRGGEEVVRGLMISGRPRVGQ